MSKQPFSLKGNKLSFNKLPPDVQARLKELLDPDDDRFVFFPRSSPLIWLGVLLPLIWFGYVFLLTQGSLWEDWMFWLIAAATVIAAFVLAVSLTKILRAVFLKVKNASIFTTDEFIKIENNNVQSVNLADIDALTYLENERCLEIWLGDRPLKLRVYNEYKANQLEKVFSQWKSQASRGFLSNYAKPEFAANPAGKVVWLSGALVVSLLLGFGLTYAAKGMNRSYDDDQSWKAASSDGSVKAFDEYKSRHPQGDHVSEADGKTSQLLSGLKIDYLARAKKTADQNAVAAFASVLESVSGNPHLTIYVRVREAREFDNSVIEKMKTQLGVNPYSYDQALPVSKTDSRKNLVFEKLKLAFGEQIKNAAVNIEPSDEPPSGSPLIDVIYTIKSDEFYYSYFSRSAGGRQRSYYPGAKFIFNFSLKPDGNANSFEANYENAPKSLDSGIFKAEDSGNYSFDAVLFGLVSDDFRNHIQSKFGFIDITNS